MKKRIFSLIMALSLMLGGLPTTSFIAGELDICYVSKSTGNDTNVGTAASPVQTFTQAVEKVADGGMIYVMDNVYLLDKESNDAPFVITKNIKTF